MLFVFEGIDGVGKSSVSKSVLKRLNNDGIESVRFFEPTKMKWGQKIRDIFEQGERLDPEEEAELFMKDRKDDVEKQIKPALERGKVVLLDRYYFSTAAYQGAEGMEWQRIIQDNEEFCVLPDAVFFLQLNPVDALERIKNDGRKKTAPEKLETLSRIEEIYYDIFFTSDVAKYEILTLDASLSVEQLTRMIASKIKEKLS